MTGPATQLLLTEWLDRFLFPPFFYIFLFKVVGFRSFLSRLPRKSAIAGMPKVWKWLSRLPKMRGAEGERLWLPVGHGFESEATLGRYKD